MKKLTNCPTIFLFLLIPFCLCFLSTSVPAKDYHSKYQKYKLPNQLTVLLEADSTVPLVTIQLWVRSGSAYEGKYLGSGITHFIEHMVFKGTAEKPAQQLSQELQALGGQLNALTSKEYTYFGITVPAENVAATMKLVYYLLTQADFKKEEIVKEKEVVVHEMAAIDDNPHKFLAHQFWSEAFQGHPYGEPIIGHKDIFNQIDRTKVLDYFSSRYVGQNIILVIVGDFDLKIIKNTIQETWGRLPAASYEPPEIAKKPAVIGPTKKIINRSVAKPYLMLGFYGPEITSDDLFPMDVLAEICGSGKDSRLNKKLRDKLGWVTSIGAYSYTPEVTGIWGVRANLTIADWSKVVKQILKELYWFKRNDVSVAELDRAKQRMIRSYLAGLETISGRASDLGTNEFYTRNPNFSSNYIEGIKKVTVAEIRDCAARYFRKQYFTLCVLQPEEDGVELVKDEIAKDTAVIYLEKLTNGMKVLIRQDSRLPLITVRLVALGGLLEEQQSGLSHFFTELWLKVNPQLVSKIEQSGGAIGSYSGNNSIGFTIQVLEDDLSLALFVARELIGSLPLPDDMVALVRNLQLAGIKQEDDSPYSYGMKIVRDIFYKDHPYHNTILGTEKSVLSLTKKDITAFKDKCLVSENIVLAIFGDIAKDKTIREVKEIFGNIPDKKFQEHDKYDFPAPAVEKKDAAMDIKDTVVLIAYPGTTIYDDDRFALRILDQLFSGLSGRLFDAIREEKALSYSVGSMNFVGRDPGLFIFYITTKDEDVVRAKSILQQELERIKTEGVDEEELQRVKTHILTQLQQQWESQPALALETSLDELYGLGWSFYKDNPEKIKKVSIADIKRVANKYFRDDWYTEVIVGPREKSKIQDAKTKQ